jgi:hypothetical protein
MVSVTNMVTLETFRLAIRDGLGLLRRSLRFATTEMTRYILLVYIHYRILLIILR